MFIKYVCIYLYIIKLHTWSHVPEYCYQIFMFSKVFLSMLLFNSFTNFACSTHLLSIGYLIFVTIIIVVIC